ncbi:hypothetical protein [Rathayibacter sp. VKM Ac-2760]|uniref:hypothetical protein n=1 Tax=Rathayibacter sp. VKM Ac-2760 TaxID=2609253 RepID=UPI0013178AAB|nr:hypothetical protein [Rathayibacter sp. VKM Ac-2760]QHC57515.1 hypothetical protein GSU72_02145 [Rathayibacter sp. VKM Ac-2760]
MGERPWRMAALSLSLLVLAACTAQTLERSTPTPISIEIDASALRSAPIPSICEHPAGSLVDGSLPGIPENQGYAFMPAVTEATPAGTNLSLVAAGGTHDDPVVAAVLRCNRGGVHWPDQVGLWTSSFEFLGLFEPAQAVDGFSEAITELSASGESFTVRWVAGNEGDPSCCGTLSAEADVSWDGARININNTRAFDGSDAVVAVAEAVSQNEEVPESAATAQATTALARLVDLGASPNLEALACEASPDIALGQRICTAPLDETQSVEIGVEIDGWNDYRVVTAYVQ